MSTEIRPEQRLTILKHLAGGKHVQVVATIVHLDSEIVRQVAQSHGYPDLEKLKWAVDVVQKNIDDARTADIPKGTAPSPRVASVPSQPTTAAAPTSAPAKPDEFRVLINTAKNHDRARIQKLADRILDDLAKLRGLIDAEQEAYQARQRVAQEKAVARAEVERLEQQLREAKAKLHPSKKTSTSESTDDGASASEVRSWAIQQGIEVPGRGRLPQEVRDAYDEAHHQEAS